jgi:transcriptional regulator with XRE-family HTH domain
VCTEARASGKKTCRFGKPRYGCGVDGDLDESVLSAVGPRLRELRRARNKTLAQLAEETGVSTSTLSRLESGQREPTLKLLLPLSRAYGVPLDDLVGAPQTGDPRIHMKPFKRAGKTWVPLTRDLGGLQAYKMIMPVPKEPVTRRPEQRVHEGREWLYVLSGRVLLALGERDIVLRSGEAAEFDTRIPHGFANAGKRPVEILSLFGPQGERIHLRARPGQD